MKANDMHDFGSYPRRFQTYKWYKPILVGLLFIVFMIIADAMINSLTELLFSVTVSGTGYDNIDYYTAAGAFKNGARGADALPCLILAALIVRDRPVSSYFSSMGGWRWKVFLKTLAAGLVIVGIPYVTRYVLSGREGDVRFTAGGLFILVLLIPLQGVAEEIEFRSFILQTFSSWFGLTVVGIIAQMILFAAIHPYNLTGVIEIAASALIYAVICICAKGIEPSSALHIVNNMTGLLMVGFGYGKLSAEASVSGVLFNLGLKVLFLLFILFADRKLHWFDEVKRDDVAQFHSRRKGKMGA